ncbi:Glycosyl-hydrolase 97 C-terminal, oligomerisation [Porphyromonadaceae bacterium KHP3R9]|jgi:hypothetical protein|nr:Glycosyl-hydrolase 97 C-terminal, oligomerisation [Porphyromonadaceae bacterium KHP3R9]
MKRTIPLILMLLLTCGAIDAEKKYGISSHDGQLTAEITVGKHLSRSLFRDGANAHRKGSDFKSEMRDVKSDNTLKLYLAPDGGFAIKLRKK